MLANPGEFMPFLDMEDSEVTAGISFPFTLSNTPETFEDYCRKVATTTAWGGQLELKALVHALHRPIIVHTAEANAPDIEMGMEYPGPALHLSYHRHYYSLGEHYNSVVPIAE